MEVDVYKIDGTKSGEKVTLAPDGFGIIPNDHAVYQAVRVQQANEHQGTHKTKGRSEVRGGGKKPWKQKHTGRARAGTSRSPLWVGGGTIFGPRPHDYVLKIPARVKALARKSALAHKAQRAEIIVVEDFSFDPPKTKSMTALLKALNLDATRTLLLVPKADGKVLKSGRNIFTLDIREAANASTVDLLDNGMLLIQRSAVDVLNTMFHAARD